jgi:large subunit ribosomal protein L15
MAIRTDKKTRKRRGSRTHGWGIVRTHRKSGMRGGVGHPAPKSHFKIQVIKGLRPPIGKRGFIRPAIGSKRFSTINISHLEAMIPKLIKENIIDMKNNLYEINLIELGYTKLLAQGSATVPMHITVEKASAKAIEKVKSAGGKIKIAK